MDTSFRTIDGEPWFLIHDLEEEYHEAARQLGYRDVPGGFGSIAPAENPNIQRAYANFERCARTMIEQAAGAEPVPWERTLQELLPILADPDVDWWLLGSAALAVRGLAVTPRDIDLVVSEESAFRLEELLLDYLVQPVIATPGWVHASFARAFLHSRVEWVGGVDPVADEEFPSDQGPIAASCLERVIWQCHEIRVPPLEFQLEVSRRRGLDARAALIEGHYKEP